MEKMLWKSIKREFDLILMDVNMPILDGISAMKQIKILETEVNTNKHLLLHLLLTQLLVIKRDIYNKVWMVIYQNLLNLKSFYLF